MLALAEQYDLDLDQGILQYTLTLFLRCKDVTMVFQKQAKARMHTKSIQQFLEFIIVYN